MSRFLLVPDLWFAPSIWQPVVSVLQRQHEVMLADVFPGDAAERWIDSVALALQQSQPDTLVVHGTAAAVIANALDRIPNPPERIVMVAGLAVATGRQAMLDELLADNPANAVRGHVEDRGEQRHLAASVLVDAFYTDTEPVVANAVGAVTVDATLFTTPLAAWSIDATLHYIECVEDQYIHVTGQRRFRDSLGITWTNTLQTGHLPMLTAPETFAACIAKVGINDSRYNR